MDLSDGAGSVTKSGRAGWDEPDFACYRLVTAKGQKIRLRVTPRNSDLAFTVSDIVDNRDDYTFVADRPEYRIQVYRTLARRPAAAFRIAMNASPGAGARTEARWTSASGPQVVNAQASAADGKTRMHLACNLSLADISFNIGSYGGAVLARDENVSSPVTLSIRDAAGREAAFKASVHYFAPDREWISDDGSVAPAFLDAFGAGGSLTIAGKGGETIAEVSLAGAAAVRDTMRRVCRK